MLYGGTWLTSSLGTLILISWNCRELGNPTKVQVIVDLVHSKRLEVLFLIETFINSNKFQPIKIKLSFTRLFVVESIGHSRGLALLWKNGATLILQVTPEITLMQTSILHVVMSFRDLPKTMASQEELEKKSLGSF